MRVDDPNKSTANFILTNKLPSELSYLDVASNNKGARIKQRCYIGDYKQVGVWF